MKTTKFILSGGKHFYVEVPEKIFRQLNESVLKHKFVIIEGRRFEFAGTEVNGAVPVFKEAEMLELKIAKVGLQLVKSNFKLGEAVLNLINPEQSIDQFIDNLGVKRNDPLLDEIRKIKHQDFVSPSDKAKIKVLWWEAKRQAFRNQLDQAGLKGIPTGEERKFSAAVLEELKTRIADALEFYNSFPKVK